VSDHGSRGGARPPRSRFRKYWYVWTALGLVVAGIAAWGLVNTFSAPPLCGDGLTQEGSICVGLDLNSTAFRHGDQFADLEAKAAAVNDAVTGPKFGTILVLLDMAPDPRNTSVGILVQRHQIEGAITAVWRADNEAVADGSDPPLKLLFANFGDGAVYWQQAVAAIVAHVGSQHIVAVTGIGQSLDTTRQAVSALSAAGIVTVGSVVTADNMNQWPDGVLTSKFFRVAATNTDMAKAAVSYLAKKHYSRILLVQDRNGGDSYASTLGTAFSAAYSARFHAAVPYAEPYLSPDGPLTGIPRSQYMVSQFAGMHADICQDKPDLIYFAGRGTDLAAFLTALSQGGACGLGPVDVLSGDDASTLAGSPLPNFGALQVNVFYTSEAAGNEWTGCPACSDEVQNYQKFEEAFVRNGFPPADLADGQASMGHDAVLAAATAARLDPDATSDPSTMAAPFLRFSCRQPIPGASGDIAFDSAGNPKDKAMPIMRVKPDGSVVQQDLAWATGQPFAPANCR